MKYYKENIGVFRLSGIDVIDFLQRVSTNDLRNLKEHGIIRTVLLNEKGKIIDFATILSIEDVVLLITSKGNDLKVKEYFEKYIVTDDVSFTLEYVDKITMLPKQEKDYLYLEGRNCTEGNYTYFDTFRFKKIVVLEYNSDAEFLNLLIQNSELLSEDDFKNIAIDKYYFYNTSELNEDINPLECGLKEYISFNKGCYIGQEVISRLDSQNKVTKVMLKIHSDFETKAGNKIYFNNSGKENECGFISSSGKTEIGYTALGFIRGISLNEEYDYYINNNVKNVISINKFKY